MGNTAYDDYDLNAFREATLEFDAVYAKFAKNCGLSETEYWSLLSISEGITTQSEISEWLSINRQTINSAFKQLIKKGLIHLETLESNQRVKKAILTTDGKKFVEKNIVKMYELEEKAWMSMTEEERGTLTKLTRKYSKLVKEALEQ